MQAKLLYLKKIKLLNKFMNLINSFKTISVTKTNVSLKKNTYLFKHGINSYL